MQGETAGERAFPSLAAIDAACFALRLAEDAQDAAAFRLFRVNPAMERLAGVSDAAMRDLPLEALLGGEDAGALLALCRACVQSRHVQHCTHVVSPPAGRMLWRTALVPFFDSRGMVEGLLGSAALVAPPTPEPELTLHGDILYYNALARMPLSQMLRLVQMRRMDPTPIDPATARALEMLERLCLAAEEAVVATEAAAKAAMREARAEPVSAAMWNALFEGMRAP
ncbi:PAS domain-containing protein [Rubrimonas cliftonensis]|uniref:PAS fold-containing protein n=1 Tax=Rubrimonas cliftonensis TaxID=89524 RepID=A0A1H4G8Z5_9RHOB|nr:PAS domain-containing protein [Rubrimonas cliftonensis]SEB06123.1 PAS fold-containing protein [Rubrimonas cliftonensis]